MPELRHIDGEILERWRAYLKLLASNQVDSWLHHRIDASDLVQQTMLDAVARNEQFRGTSDGELIAWLRTILANNLVDAFRYHTRAKRNAACSVSLEDEISHSFRRVDAFMTDSQSTPSQRAVTNDQLLRLPIALDGLPDGQREAVTLHHLQGLTLSETATRLDAGETNAVQDRGQSHQRTKDNER